MPSSYTAVPGRVDWVDYAKGFCIIMVVMMHSTLGVEEAAGREGSMHGFVMFARPFRMPDFFLISGLFMSRVIDRDWRAPGHQGGALRVFLRALGDDPVRRKGTVFRLIPRLVLCGKQYALAFIEPFGTLWFIYLLPIFFVVTKAARSLPPALGSARRCALQIAQIDTGWTAIDEFAGRFVYFFAGYVLAGGYSGSRHWVRLTADGPLGLAAWAMVNGALVVAGLADLRVVSLALGLVGAAAVVAFPPLWHRPGLRSGALLRPELDRHLLAFFLPMAATRTLLMKTGLAPDVGVMALLITAAGVIGALLIWWAARGTRANFLFERPDLFRIAPRSQAALQPAA